jgi:outer membrane lipoprotein SlyB
LSKSSRFLQTSIDSRSTDSNNARCVHIRFLEESIMNLFVHRSSMAVLVSLSVAAYAQTTTSATPAPAAKPAAAAVAAVATAASGAQAAVANKIAAVTLCDTCATVVGVAEEKRKGKGGALGTVGGAVVGGVLGNQVGGGDGKKVATVAGAVGGAVAGNEIQKRMSRKTVWVTTLKLKDGTERKVEQETAPGWAAGNTVKQEGAGWVKI